jgi:hypothetical protein
MVAKKTADPDSLQSIPGVGPSIEADLQRLGIKRVRDLKRMDPDRLYERHCWLEGGHVDRCVLYVFRCAVYYATEEKHTPRLLKWWNWKDRPGK